MPPHDDASATAHRPGLIRTFFPPLMLAIAVYAVFGWIAAVIVLLAGCAFSWWFVHHLGPRWLNRHGADESSPNGADDDSHQ